MKTRLFIACALLAMVALLVLLVPRIGRRTATQGTGPNIRISVSSSGKQGDNWSHSSSISADGRYVLLLSDATNLVPGDTNDARDVFIHNRQTGQTTRVSVASDGTQGNAGCYWPIISAGGRYVTFSSDASNLVPDDTNGQKDIFVRDRQTSHTGRVSTTSHGIQGNRESRSPCISADGRYVAFASRASNLVPGDTNDCCDIFIADRHVGEITRISVAWDGTQGNGASDRPSISSDGRYVAFSSDASNLVPDDTNGVGDVFVHDRQTGRTTGISVSLNGLQGNGKSWAPHISADGRHVAFSSAASNLAPGDTNGTDDAFVHDQGSEPLPTP